MFLPNACNGLCFSTYLRPQWWVADERQGSHLMSYVLKRWLGNNTTQDRNLRPSLKTLYYMNSIWMWRLTAEKSKQDVGRKEISFIQGVVPEKEHAHVPNASSQREVRYMKRRKCQEQRAGRLLLGEFSSFRAPTSFPIFPWLQCSSLLELTSFYL